MILNNIECDLDELIWQHGDHKVEAIRELRKLTGLTLKEAKKYWKIIKKETRLNQ